MPSNLGRAILKTLTYCDIFDYPLTEAEIWKRLIRHKDTKLQRVKAAKGQSFKEVLFSLERVKEKGNFYFLKGREHIVDIRKERENWSREKLKIAKEIASLLKLIPSIKLVGITGALAVENSDKLDDIDLFIVTSPKLIWITRFFTTVLVEMTGKRRHPGQADVSDKICLNMFVDEEHLSIDKKERDLFSAHEVVQMKPIWDRDNTYKKFLDVNIWVRKFLPNAFVNLEHITKNIKLFNKTQSRPKNKKKFLVHSSWFIVRLLEESSKRFQLWYMRKRRTKEVIRDGVIRFHPQDARKWVMEKYLEKMSSFSISD